jgi:hypothetical protein
MGPRLGGGCGTRLWTNGSGTRTRKEQTVLAHARSGGAAFDACLRIFRQYPLAVRRHYAEHRYGSMVLMDAGHGAVRYFVLIMEWDDLFVLRHWDRRAGPRLEIGRDEPAPGDVAPLLESCVPVPRDGALLGWLAGQQVRAVLAAHGRLPEPWEDASAVPGMTVLPLAASPPADWPPFADDPLGGGRLWRHAERGQLVDLAPLLACRAGRAFAVPGVGGPSGSRGARIVVTERLRAAGFWLPAGVYADHRSLRDGPSMLTPRQLLAQPGVVDLAGGRLVQLLGA